ncbi:hypothetical protein BC828DRAFT_388356 [Blastocladiella britannica]|nr:hypothetical protein BC828DRAFT_388356 [Blastocladiella britannica]
MATPSSSPQRREPIKRKVVDQSLYTALALAGPEDLAAPAHLPAFSERKAPASGIVGSARVAASRMTASVGPAASTTTASPVVAQHAPHAAIAAAAVVPTDVARRTEFPAYPQMQQQPPLQPQRIAAARPRQRRPSEANSVTSSLGATAAVEPPVAGPGAPGAVIPSSAYAAPPAFGSPAKKPSPLGDGREVAAHHPKHHHHDAIATSRDHLPHQNAGAGKRYSGSSKPMAANSAAIIDYGRKLYKETKAYFESTAHGNGDEEELDMNSHLYPSPQQQQHLNQHQRGASFSADPADIQISRLIESKKKLEDQVHFCQKELARVIKDRERIRAAAFAASEGPGGGAGANADTPRHMARMEVHASIEREQQLRAKLAAAEVVAARAAATLHEEYVGKVRDMSTALAANAGRVAALEHQVLGFGVTPATYYYTQEERAARAADTAQERAVTDDMLLGDVAIHARIGVIEERRARLLEVQAAADASYAEFVVHAHSLEARRSAKWNVLIQAATGLKNNDIPDQGKRQAWVQRLRATLSTAASALLNEGGSTSAAAAGAQEPAVTTCVPPPPAKLLVGGGVLDASSAVAINTKVSAVPEAAPLAQGAAVLTKADIPSTAPSKQLEHGQAQSQRSVAPPSLEAGTPIATRAAPPSVAPPSVTPPSVTPEAMASTSAIPPPITASPGLDTPTANDTPAQQQSRADAPPKRVPKPKSRIIQRAITTTAAPATSAAPQADETDLSLLLKMQAIAAAAAAASVAPAPAAPRDTALAPRTSVPSTATTAEATSPQRIAAWAAPSPLPGKSGPTSSNPAPKIMPIKTTTLSNTLGSGSAKPNLTELPGTQLGREEAKDSGLALDIGGMGDWGGLFDLVGSD